MTGDAVIQRDPYGNTLGGIRMPEQEVPTGRNTPSFGCPVLLPGLAANTVTESHVLYTEL
jgi:hypothetical protein